MVVVVLGLTGNHQCNIWKDHKIMKDYTRKKIEMKQNWERNIISHRETPVRDDRKKHGLQF